MLKVILIDDEIMAINHMKSLVDWSSYGFEIIGTFTSALKGLEFIKKEKVDIIFVDIRMPGMDGLTFSEKALNLNNNLEIVLLTSYGEFDYAKKAISIGVFSYLLKHEMKSDTLIIELEDLRSSITKKKQGEKLLLSQLISKLISIPDKITKDEIKRINQLLCAGMMNIMTYLVVLDVPYQIFNEKEQYNLKEFKEEAVTNYMDLKNKDMVTIYLTQEKWLVLKVFEPIVSQRQILDETYITAYGLQRYIFQQYGMTVSIIPSAVFNDIEELPYVFNNLIEISQYLIFYDKNKILHKSEIVKHTNMEKIVIDEIIEEIHKGLIQGELEFILKKVDLFFGICSRKFDAKAFHYFSHQIIQLIKYFANKEGLNYIFEQSRKEMNSIYSADQMHAWIAIQFDRLHNEMINKEICNYSPRISEAIRYIVKNYHNDIKVDDIANEVNVSGDYLRHIFKKEVGKGFNDFLTEVRVEKSKKLLLEDKYKLYEIASMVGYSSGAYFSTVFKKITGILPQDYVG